MSLMAKGVGYRLTTALREHEGAGGSGCVAPNSGLPAGPVGGVPGPGRRAALRF